MKRSTPAVPTSAQTPISRAKNAREMGHPARQFSFISVGCRPICALWLILFAAGFLLGQGTQPTIYAESFRKGTTRITEESFEAKLTPQNATYREMIKDTHGNDRYELTIVPQGPEGDNKITSWRVRLRDLHHSIYSNILLAEQQPSTEAKNNLWWLDPNQFGPVPIRARRVMKVDGFYVVLQVKDLHFTPLDSPYLDSMAVQFTFTNSDPRSVGR